MHQVVAEADGLAISDLVKVIPFRPVQEHTNIILDWLANNAEANTGHPQFKNEDLGHIIGWVTGGDGQSAIWCRGWTFVVRKPDCLRLAAPPKPSSRMRGIVRTHHGTIRLTG